MKKLLLSLQHQKLRILIWSLIATPFIFYSCVEIIVDNPEQHRRSDRFDTLVSDIQKGGDTSFSSIYRPMYGEETRSTATLHNYWWQTYAAECQKSKPRIPQKTCLHMIIEAPTMEGAQASVQQTAEAIRNLLAKHPDPLLRGVVIVLTPGIRNTAYNRASFISDNFFVTGDSMIVKIGE